jgi:hypothetical protein
MRKLLTLAGVTLLALAMLPTVAVFAAEEDGLEARVAFEHLKQQFPGVQAYRTEGNATRIFGNTFSTGSSPIESADAFCANYAAALGVTADQLASRSLLPSGNRTQQLMYDPETGQYKFTLVYYAQEIDGLPVYEAELRLLVRNEPGFPLVLAVSSLRSTENLNADKSSLSLPSSSAVQVAQADETGLTDFGEQEAVVFAGVDSDYAEPTLAVTFVGSSDFPEKFRYVIEPITGEILHKENMIIFEDVVGTVSGMATPGPKEMHCTPSTMMVFPYAEVSIVGGNSVFADDRGNFVIPHGGSDVVNVASTISGQYFDVSDYGGNDEAITLSVTPPGPANFVYNALDNSEAIRAQVNGYVNANEVRDWTLTYCPTYPTIATQINFPVSVNRTDGYCPGNAWYSSGSNASINFCLSSSTYGNTSFASVSQHEYGHHMVQMAGSGQGQYGEGMGDCVAMLIADDPGLGYGFYLNDCANPLRNADNTEQYPCTGEIHACGELISGAIWDIREEMEIGYPLTYLAIVSNLTVNSILLHTGTEITPQIAIDFLVLDDDDANLDNGTPHHSEICTGFDMHNLTCPDLALVWFSFPDGLPTIVDPVHDATVRTVAHSGAVDPMPGSGKLYYSVSGRPFIQGTMTETAANEYDILLPGTACNDILSWYIEAETDGMGSATSPMNAPAETHFAMVATSYMHPLRDDFERENGWTVSGSVSDGAWDRGVPVGGGDRGDPPTDFDGSGSCYLTDNVDDNSDVDDGTTSLTSPTFNMSAGDGTIHYARWFSNTFGADPNNDVMTIWLSNDDGGSWTLVETVGPNYQSGGGWYENTFWASEFLPPTALMKMRFDASDAGAGSVVEAAIDDFLVTTYECIEGGICGDVNNNEVGPDIEDLIYLVTYMFQDGPEPIDMTTTDVNGNGIGPDIEDLIYLVTYMFQNGPDLQCY